MAKVLWFCILMVEYDIQIDISLFLITFGNLELHARLCFCIFGYPLLYQRTGKMRCFHIVNAARVGRITLSPNGTDVETQ